MKILAFDTSSIACSVALQHGEKIIALHKIAPMQQTRLLLPMINELLTAHSLKLSSLDAIAYGAGPGSFTGMRITSAVAQGLAYASNKPIIAISSLAAAAQAAYQNQRWTNVWVVVDARMEQVYSAHYRLNNQHHMELVGEEKLMLPDKINTIDSAEWYGIGDGWDNYYSRLVSALPIKPLAVDPSQLPTAKAILPLAKIKLEQGKWRDAFNAHPVYLR